MSPLGQVSFDVYSRSPWWLLSNSWKAHRAAITRAREQPAPSLRTSFVRCSQRNAACLPQGWLLACVPLTQFAVFLCSTTVIMVSWRHRLVYIWPVFTKALWSVWLYCPFLMWNDASGDLIWGTLRHTSWRIWGSHSLKALLLSDGKYRVCLYLSFVARYHLNKKQFQGCYVYLIWNPVQTVDIILEALI